MRVKLFLDIDGVLNSSSQGYVFGKDQGILCEGNVKWFRKLCQEYDLDIVLCSFWRDSEDHLRPEFERLGLQEWSDKTGKFEASRAGEIREYLRKTGYTGPFLVLDDFVEDCEIPGHVVQPNSRTGMVERDYIKACEMLDSFLDSVPKETTVSP